MINHGAPGQLPPGNCPGCSSFSSGFCFPAYFQFCSIAKAVYHGKATETLFSDVSGASDLSKIVFLCPRGPQGSREGPQGGARGAQSAISTPLWEISTPHWTSHIPHVCPGGVLPTMRQGLYRMAWSSNPMEASPLVLRSVTVLPRALLEVSADPPVRRRRQHNNNNPACINSPL